MIESRSSSSFDDPLQRPIQFVKGVGPARAKDFQALGVQTVQDLLFTFPRDLSDRSHFSTIAELEDGAESAVMVRPLESKQRRARGRRMTITTVSFTDDTGELEAVWFNSPWVLDKFTGGQVMLFGKVKREQNRVKMDHPQFELLDESTSGSGLSIGRIVPIYPCTGKLTQSSWRKVMNAALEMVGDRLPETLPPALLEQKALLSRASAVHAMHFPETPEQREHAHARLIYEECLLLQLAILRQRHSLDVADKGRSLHITEAIDQRIRALFPFRLTAAQDRSISEICRDLERSAPMHRLLQGDVGSGKTVVALYAMLAAVAHGYQVCIMAPTSLLAQQHERTIRTFLENSDKSRVPVSLLLGNTSKREREVLLESLAAGSISILIATHSAIQEEIQFRDLGLIVIDEQHKFGVRQRAELVSKGTAPDILVMTATPIPRSLAMTVYGDLDISVIDELPPGRKPVKTTAPDPSRAPEVWNFIRRELTKGRQAYIVSPLVEESEALDVTSATKAFEDLRQQHLADYRLALLHGRMKRDEQAEIMQQFRNGRIDVLVSTVVIEVGVDVPNATVMVVLHAERFGLAQLHQLRGRIGRGTESGHFIMLSTGRGETSQRRLSALCATQDGFKIAEEDLAIRGPGEFLGTRQHGIPELKLVDIVRDLAIIRKARADADALLAIDPALSQPEHRPLRTELARLLDGREAGAGLG